MATEAQIQANRLNAQRSTGPRTEEGKEKAAQNALKHGLLAREGVIRGESREEYEIHREMLLEELEPVGVLEGILATRVVDLTWRLHRAGQDRNEAFGALYDRHTAGALEPNEPHERGATLGRMILEDFEREAVLERLLRHERRIEGSLYRTLNELRRLRAESRKADREAAATLARWREEDWQARKARAFAFEAAVDGRPGPAGGTTNTPWAEVPPASEILSSPFGDPVPDVPPGDETCETNPIETRGMGPAMEGESCETNPIPGRVSSEKRKVSSESCETNPIGPDPKEGQIVCGKAVRNDFAEDGRAETKPISLPWERGGRGRSPCVGAGFETNPILGGREESRAAWDPEVAGNSLQSGHPETG